MHSKLNKTIIRPYFPMSVQDIELFPKRCSQQKYKAATLVFQPQNNMKPPTERFKGLESTCQRSLVLQPLSILVLKTSHES